MNGEELHCDSVTVPRAFKENGFSQIVVGELIRQIGQDFIDNEVVNMEEQ
jgi:hypothetical protein